MVDALIFLLVAWGIVVSPAPLESRRPPAEPGALWPTGQKTRTHARLWQDPLTSAANAAAEAATEWKKEAGGRAAGAGRWNGGLRHGALRSFRTSRRASERLCQ